MNMALRTCDDCCVSSVAGYRLDISVGLKMCGTGPARAAGAEVCEVSVGMACECFTKVSHEKA
jgi:hypothetical protein